MAICIRGGFLPQFAFNCCILRVFLRILSFRKNTSIRVKIRVLTYFKTPSSVFGDPGPHGICIEYEGTTIVNCSGATYWTGGTGGPGYIYAIGRFNGALKKFSLAGNTLTLAGVAATVGNFTKLGGAISLTMRYWLCSGLLLSCSASLLEQLSRSLSGLEQLQL